MGIIIMSAGGAIAIGLLILLVIAVVIFFVTRKKTSASCTPSDDEKTAAGGESVLNFVYNESGNCVANTCVEGYTLGGGICTKSSTVNSGGDTGGAKGGDTGGAKGGDTGGAKGGAPSDTITGEYSDGKCYITINQKCKTYPSMDNAGRFDDSTAGGPKDTSDSICKARVESWKKDCN